MSFRKIKASDGCVMFFPERTASSKRPQVISGTEETTLGWGEKWIQVRLNAVRMDIRLQGGESVHLDNDLRCEVIAKAVSQIDESDLAGSLRKMVHSLRCSATTDRKVILDEAFFRGRFDAVLYTAVHRIVKKADYLKLLRRSDGHYEDLQACFAGEVESFLKKSGFALELSDIHFTPIDPGALPEMPEITSIWLDRARVLAQQRAEKDSIAQQILEQEEKESAERTARIARESAERAARIEQELVMMKIKKREAERDNAKRLHELEIEIQDAEDRTKRTLAEKRSSLENYFKGRQEEMDAYDHSRRLAEISNDDAIKRLEEENKHARLIQEEETNRRAERARAEHESYLREQELASVKAAETLANSRLEIAKLAAAEAKTRGVAEAQVLEARIRAEKIMQIEEAKAAAAYIERLIDRLPELVAKQSCDEKGDRTAFYFGADLKPEAIGSSGIVALSLAPLLKQLVTRLGDYLLSGPKVEEEADGALGQDASVKKRVP